jgi:lipid-binding SYLF domain-containing protein
LNLPKHARRLTTKKNEQGLVIFSVFELGMMRSLRFGSGLVVARLANGTWSAPSAIATGKLSSRGQFGLEHTEYVYVLNTDAAVDQFLQAKTFTLGSGGVSIAVGPFGRSAELAGESYEADIFAYCKTRTVFGGSTLEGVTIGERVDANRKLYQKSVSPRQLLRGEVTLPAETYPLMKILHSPLLRPVAKSVAASASASAPAAGLAIIVTKAPPMSVATDEPSAPSPSQSPSPSPYRSRRSMSASSPVQSRRQSSASSSPLEGPRFYEQRRMTNPHQITIEITDCSNVELPRSLTESPEAESPEARSPDEAVSPMTERSSLDGEPDGQSATHPAVLKAGRRTWSGPSTADWSRHDPLQF